MSKRMYTLETKLYVVYLYRNFPYSQENITSSVVSIRELQNVCKLSDSTVEFTYGQLAIWLEAHLEKITGYKITIINFWEI